MVPNQVTVYERAGVSRRECFPATAGRETLRNLWPRKLNDRDSKAPENSEGTRGPKHYAKPLCKTRERASGISYMRFLEQSAGRGSGPALGSIFFWCGPDTWVSV